MAGDDEFYVWPKSGVAPGSGGDELLVAASWMWEVDLELALFWELSADSWISDSPRVLAKQD